MPTVDVVYFRDSDQSAPVLDWLVELAKRDRKAVEKCLARIELLREHGHELRRPIADILRDGVYELRVRSGRSQHRVLYFFHSRKVVVLANALTKESKVPPKEIEKAIARKRLFESNPMRYTFREDENNG
jgi:phage-related protein